MQIMLTHILLMTKFDKAEKNRTIWFWQFYNRIKKWAKNKDLKIQVRLKYEKGKENIKESIHVLTNKIYILEKSECPACQIETSVFYSDKMVNIFKRSPTLYIP
jgi:hypothetical protein